MRLVGEPLEDDTAPATLQWGPMEEWAFISVRSSTVEWGPMYAGPTMIAQGRTRAELSITTGPCSQSNTTPGRDLGEGVDG